jgi:hypothetical protein
MERLAIRLSWQTTPTKSLVIRGVFVLLDSRLRGNDAILKLMDNGLFAYASLVAK